MNKYFDKTLSKQAGLGSWLVKGLRYAGKGAQWAGNTSVGKGAKWLYKHPTITGLGITGASAAYNNFVKMPAQMQAQAAQQAMYSGRGAPMLQNARIGVPNMTW